MAKRKCRGPFVGVLALFLAAGILLVGCTKQAQSTSQAVLVGGSMRRGAVQSGELQFTAPTATDVYVTLKTDKGDVRLVLYPQQAPLAVENFCALAREGYYDGTVFHRTVQNFVVQGGGLVGESSWGTPFDTERSDLLHHYSGALCMAAGASEDATLLSQFYMVATPPDALDENALEKLVAAGVREAVVQAYRQAGGAPYLDNTDTVFGQVIEGMDIVDGMAAAAVAEDGYTPKTPVVIQSVTVENYTTLQEKGRPVYTPPAPIEVPEEVEGGEEESPLPSGEGT